MFCLSRRIAYSIYGASPLAEMTSIVFIKWLMKKIIEGWYHKPGRHCASTAIRDAMRFWGIDWNEAFCFGLGRGLGTFFINSPTISPSRWLMTRCQDLEEHFFESVGVPFKWVQAENDDRAWAMTKADIDSGFPALLQTDIYYLDYYNSKTHFNRHAVLLWGYDEEKGVGYLSDTERDGLLEVRLESIARSRTSPIPPGPVLYDYFPMEKPHFRVDIAQAALRAVLVQAFDLIGPPKDFPLKMGLNGLVELARDLPHWKDVDDLSWCARFNYQTIEKRGTGGSAFRKMYTEFLEQVEEMHPRIKKLELSSKMRLIAQNWSKLATILKDISESLDTGKLEEAAETVKSIHGLEKNYCHTALEEIPKLVSSP